ncbi:hypothetical protein ACQKEG_25025, partial [Klebsiella quasipneumoniae]
DTTEAAMEHIDAYGFQPIYNHLAERICLRVMDRLLTVRFLSDDNLICQQVMRDVWQFLRPHLTGKSPVLPRIWLT